MTITYALGKDAKIYQGTAGGTISTLTEMSNVKDVTLTLESDEADVTTRANGGWKATVATLKSCTVEFEMLFLPSDTGFTAIRTAYLGSSLLRLAVLTGDKATSGSEGMLADFSITNFSRSEQLAEGITYSVTAKLATFDAWTQITGS